MRIFNFILVLVFFYLVYQIFLRPLFTPSRPYTNTQKDDIHEEPKTDITPEADKKIDMSKVEDADYKELD